MRRNLSGSSPDQVSFPGPRGPRATSGVRLRQFRVRIRAASTGSPLSDRPPGRPQGAPKAVGLLPQAEAHQAGPE